MPAPQLPTWQDCHELWSKKRKKRQLREQQESLQNLPPGKPLPGGNAIVPSRDMKVVPKGIDDPTQDLLG